MGVTGSPHHYESGWTPVPFLETRQCSAPGRWLMAQRCTRHVVRTRAQTRCSRSVFHPGRMFGRRLRQLLIRSYSAIFSLALLAVGARADAQPTLSALQGIVRNESAHPIEQAQVLLNPGAGTRELRTDRDGRFRFIGVSPGTHRLRVLRIGFQPHDTTVTVAGTNTEVAIELRRLTTLREVEVTSRRTGVYGTVMGRDSLQPLEGARVELLGARVRDTTDATGAFAMQANDVGTFMLRVTRDGYDTRLLSVRVPKDTGVAIDIVLRPGSPALDAHMEMLWADMAQRVNWKGVEAAVVGREELLNHGSDLSLAIRFAPSSARKGIVVDDRACLFVDGIARPLATIKDFSVDEIESIELYPAGSELTKNLIYRWPARAICGNPSATPAPRGVLRAVQVVIWTRR